MSKKFFLAVVAAIVLAACEPSSDIDEDQLERENRQILRQLGGD